MTRGCAHGRARRPIGRAAVVLVFGLLVAPAAGGEWLAGDLHVHTTYSHDSWSPLDDDNTDPAGGDVEDAITLGHSVEGQFLLASLRGLDYLAITDHNRVRAKDDPGWGAFGVIPIHSYENSLRGHAQMHGARRLYAKAGDPLPADGSGPADASPAAVRSIADQLRLDGGVFQVNHPALESTDFPADADWEPARSGYDSGVVPDVVEVWNISPLWQPPFPSASSTGDAIRWWEGWLDRGEKVGATGGSDNHWISTTAIQGVGQPTTWVFASERSEAAILEGLRRGRTTISFQPPRHGGPRIFLEADADGDGVFESMIGDTVAAGSAFRAHVTNAPPGAWLRIITDGGAVAFDPVPVVGPEAVHDFRLPGGAWVRADLVLEDFSGERAQVCDDPLGSRTTYCRNRLLLLAMTSAMYLE